MLAVDMDGTLLGGDGQVSPRTLASLQAAHAAGIRVVVATGRRHSYAMRQLRSLGLHDTHIVVSSNGAVVRTLAAALVARTFLDRESALRLCAHLGEFRDALVITFDRIGANGDDERGALVVEELAELHSSIGRWMIANEPYIEHVRPIERALTDREPIQMMLCGTIARMRRAEALLRELPGVQASDGDTGPNSPSASEEHGTDCSVTLHRTEYPDRDLSLLDILPSGCSKGAALLRLAAGWGIHASEMMAVGDNWNDLSMLRVAGRPVLMGNAPPELLREAAAHGWQITARNIEDGVAQALEELLAAEAVGLASR